MQPFLIEKQAEIAELCRKHHVKRLFVFGSAARDDFDAERSDVDLLVEFEDGYVPAQRFLKLDLESDFESLFHRSVHLAVRRALRNPYFIRQVNIDKQMLYAA